MDSAAELRIFPEEYGRLRAVVSAVKEDAPQPVPEIVLQCVWYDQLFDDEGLATDEGAPLRIVSPGWWNHSEGPDFRDAQIEFGGVLHTGDVEIHLSHAGWTQHGHHRDSRYNGVILVVTLEPPGSSPPPLRSDGGRIATLAIKSRLHEDLGTLRDRLSLDDFATIPSAPGRCLGLSDEAGAQKIVNIVLLAGAWRMLNKARALRERMDKVGGDQAVYEAFMSACGYSHFKHHFRAIAQQFHYQRVRQLGQQDAHLLEAGFFQVGGLLPNEPPADSATLPHYARLRGLRRDRLTGLRSLPLEWRRVGVRPNNSPERRLAGAARFLAQTAEAGLLDTIEGIWREDIEPLERRRRFESLFPAPVGFWSTHCTWTAGAGKPTAPFGEGRVRSIIGNVFVPVGLAIARRGRDRLLEESVLDFFSRMPKEPDNHIVALMGPRLLGEIGQKRMDFRTQQGLLQVYQDWCEQNPSCRGCRILEAIAGRL